MENVLQSHLFPYLTPFHQTVYEFQNFSLKNSGLKWFTFLVFITGFVDHSQVTQARRCLELKTGTAQGFRGRAYMYRTALGALLGFRERSKTLALTVEPCHFQEPWFKNECKWMFWFCWVQRSQRLTEALWAYSADLWTWIPTAEQNNHENVTLNFLLLKKISLSAQLVHMYLHVWV